MDPPPDLPAPSLFDLGDSNALVTGATRGIGAACALALAEAGAKVCLVQRPPGPDGAENKDTYNTIIAAGGSATIIHCDLEDLDQVRTLFSRALEAMGGSIHVLVNCAGIQRRHPSTEFPESDWDDASTFVININLKVCWILAQAAGQHMVPLRRGKIINMCSLLTFQGGFTVPAYAAAKGALGQVTKALSNEWSQHNVQVNGICPGYIATDMNEKLLKDPVRLRQILERIPAGRWGQPKDFAGPVVFLASRASQYVCGEILVVDGVSVSFSSLFFSL
ncbi:2-dehydro-3-deoxy-D-gluconate 5-dehydrogenase [Leucoagaricus sp. SymC.cos]|nr:2-dehydro-3-deoxy-D-gluconate 5-dehydrogenase [Leucoagaricus sp. SymC.cos]